MMIADLGEVKMLKSLHEVSEDEFGVMLKELGQYLKDENDRVNRIIRIASESAGDVRENLEVACKFFKERGIILNLNELISRVEELRRKEHSRRISMAKRGRGRKKMQEVANNISNNSDNNVQPPEQSDRWVDEKF